MRDTTTLRVVRTRLNSHNNTVDATLQRWEGRDEDVQVFIVTFPATLALGLGIYPERELTLTLSDEVTV